MESKTGPEDLIEWCQVNNKVGENGWGDERNEFVGKVYQRLALIWTWWEELEKSMSYSICCKNLF